LSPPLYPKNPQQAQQRNVAIFPMGSRCGSVAPVAPYRGPGKSPATSAPSAHEGLQLVNDPGDGARASGRAIAARDYRPAVPGRPVSAGAGVAALRPGQVVTLVSWPWPLFYHNRYL